MASRRFYAYYIRGNQLALVEHDSVSGDGQTLGQPSLDDIGPSGGLQWKSPTATVADGLEIEYAYSPRYNIQQAADKDTNINQYRADGGYLRIADNTSAYTNYGTSPALGVGNTLVLRKAGRFNGPHIIRALTSGGPATNNEITLETSYNGLSNAWTNFEETVELYYTVDSLDGEADTIDLPEYLSKGLVYYVQAKVAEDQGDVERKEYFMREFRRILEKHESSKIRGPRMMIPGGHGIR